MYLGVAYVKAEVGIKKEEAAAVSAGASEIGGDTMQNKLRLIIR